MPNNVPRWGVYNVNRKIHIVPLDDYAEHLFDVSCPCHPKLEENDKILIHNAFDKREQEETPQ